MNGKFVQLDKTVNFCRAMLCITAVYAVVRCPSVAFEYSVETNKRIFKSFSSLGSHTILVSRVQVA